MSKRALICDDSRLTRRMIADALTEDGWQVAGEAETAVEIVDLFRQHRPDLVTMDLALKGHRNGVWAVREIRKTDPHAAVVVVSSVTQPNVVAESLQAGASEYLCKPFQADELREAVTRCVAAEASSSV